MAEENRSVVRRARRNDGVVGFFTFAMEVPEGWTPDGQMLDLSSEVKAMGCTLEERLMMLNAHWIARERPEKERSVQRRSSAA